MGFLKVTSFSVLRSGSILSACGNSVPIAASFSAARPPRAPCLSLPCTNRLRLRAMTRQDALDFVGKKIRQARLWEEHIASCRERTLLVAFKCARGQHDDGRVLRPFALTQAANQLNAIECAADADPGHDDIGLSRRDQPIVGRDRDRRREAASPEIFHVHVTAVVVGLDEQEGGWSSHGLTSLRTPTVPTSDSRQVR